MFLWCCWLLSASLYSPSSFSSFVYVYIWHKSTKTRQMLRIAYNNKFSTIFCQIESLEIYNTSVVHCLLSMVLLLRLRSFFFLFHLLLMKEEYSFFLSLFFFQSNFFVLLAYFSLIRYSISFSAFSKCDVCSVCVCFFLALSLYFGVHILIFFIVVYGWATLIYTTAVLHYVFLYFSFFVQRWLFVFGFGLVCVDIIYWIAATAKLNNKATKARDRIKIRRTEWMNEIFYCIVFRRQKVCFSIISILFELIRYTLACVQLYANTWSDTYKIIWMNHQVRTTSFNLQISDKMSLSTYTCRRRRRSSRSTQKCRMCTTATITKRNI